jgi:hypothetical protein
LPRIFPGSIHLQKSFFALASDQKVLEMTSALPFAIPDSVVSLYAWKDGTQEGQAPYNQMWVWPWYYMLPLERAIESYSSLSKIRPWKSNLFPLFKSSGGDYFGVACQKDRTDDGEVFLYMQGDPKLRPKCSSLSKFLQFTLACFERNAFFTANGNFDMNDDSCDAIATEFDISA